jgi:hypothetical protein
MSAQTLDVTPAERTPAAAHAVAQQSNAVTARQQQLAVVWHHGLYHTMKAGVCIQPGTKAHYPPAQHTSNNCKRALLLSRA